MKVLRRFGVVDELLKQGDRVRENGVDHGDESTVVGVLVRGDELLPVVPIGLFGVKERTLTRELDRGLYGGV
jgi:hypothetical protein